MLRRAARSLNDQLNSGFNLAWCAFDLAQLCLYTGDSDNFIKSVHEGIVLAQMAAGTFRETLELLNPAGIDLPRLHQGIALLKETDDLQV